MSACCVPEVTRSSPIHSGVHYMFTFWRNCLSPEKVRKALIQDPTETKTLKPVFKYGHFSQSCLSTPVTYAALQPVKADCQLLTRCLRQGVLDRAPEDSWMHILPVWAPQLRTMASNRLVLRPLFVS